MLVDQLQPQKLLLACRLCLCPEQNVCLSSDSVADFHYADIAAHLLDFKILQHASLPHKICMSCASNLILFHKFRTKCEEVNASLLQRIVTLWPELKSGEDECAVPSGDDVNRLVDEDEDGSSIGDAVIRLQVQDDTHDPFADDSLLEFANEVATESECIVQFKEDDGSKTIENNEPIATIDCANNDVGNTNDAVTDVDEVDSEFADGIEEYLLEELPDGANVENNDAIEPLNSDLTNNIDEDDDEIMEYDDLESLHSLLSQSSSQPSPDERLSASPSPPPDKSACPTATAARRQFACSHCSRQFTRKFTCEQHERTHRGLKEHECQLCAARFTRSSHLVVHMRIHQNVRPYACDECGRRFTKRGDLYRHGSVHRAERDFRCGHCAKCFKRLTDLQSHQLTHTGHKPYVCGMPRCDKAYTSHSSLKKHRMRWH